MRPPDPQTCERRPVAGRPREDHESSEHHLNATTQLLTQYRAARARLDSTISLLERTIEFRERLWFGLDLVDMRVEHAELKRDVAAHKRGAA